MRKPSLATALLALGLPGLVAAGDAASPAPDWIAGHWCGGTADERIEEYWMAPHGDVLLGIARTVKGGRTTSFEYLRIVVDAGVPAYVAQPGGAAPTAFRRTAGAENWVRFENPAHDFPQRIEYRRAGDALHAEIAGPGEDGKEVVIGFDFERCRVDP
jgi:hypothetical protein